MVAPKIHLAFLLIATFIFCASSCTLRHPTNLCLSESVASLDEATASPHDCGGEETTPPLMLTFEERAVCSNVAEETDFSNEIFITGGSSCAEGMLFCASECIDPDTDPNHCGACDSPCEAGEICGRGQCIYDYHRFYPDDTIYYGELHGHSALSLDARGTPEEYYTYCRDVAQLDFCALTDHDIDQTALNIMSRVADKMTSSEFVALNGVEWSSIIYGHKACYDVTVACRSIDEECDTPEKLYDSIVKHGGACHHAHPTLMPGIGLIEYDTIFGTSASKAIFNGEFFGGSHLFESSMNIAWNDYGLKLGTVAVGDSHRKSPGSVHTTACYARELTREAILDALKNRKCYAITTRANRTSPDVLVFKINDSLMGEVAPDDETFRFTVATHVTHPIRSIVLKKNGVEIARKSDCFGNVCEWNDAVTSDGPAYYYVMVQTQSDFGHIFASPMLVSSPIFVE